MTDKERVSNLLDQALDRVIASGGLLETMMEDPHCFALNANGLVENGSTRAVDWVKRYYNQAEASIRATFFLLEEVENLIIAADQEIRGVRR